MNAKTIVITGASGGIGAGLARRLGRDGTRLVLAARRRDELEQVAGDAEAVGAVKAALNALTANLRVDLRERFPNTTVTLVMPGMVGTAFGRNALGSLPDTPIYSGPYVQKVEEVADIIALAIEHPEAEIYTNAASAGMAQRYFADVAGFEAAGATWGSAPSGAR